MGPSYARRVKPRTFEAPLPTISQAVCSIFLACQIFKNLDVVRVVCFVFTLSLMQGFAIDTRLDVCNAYHAQEPQESFWKPWEIIEEFALYSCAVHDRQRRTYGLSPEVVLDSSTEVTPDRIQPIQKAAKTRCCRGIDSLP